MYKLDISEETKKKMSESHKGQKLSEETKKKISESLKGRIPYNKGISHTDQWKKDMSEKMKGRSITWGYKISKSLKGKYLKDKNSRWYGTIGWYHQEARKLFGKDNCEMCNKTMKEELETQYRKLAMHCTSNPKDYTIMNQENWRTLCVVCHGIVEVK